MNNPTDTNQASEDELKELLETLDGPYGWRADIERLIKQHELEAMKLIRTEKLKLLAEVRERVVGENEPEFNTPKPELGNMARNRLREAQTDLLTKLEAEL